MTVNSAPSTARTWVSTAVDVETSAARAFHVFTAEIGTWWDADKHILDAELAGMEFEAHVGGNIVDRGVDGSECRWARVLAYEPPHRVVFSWDINVNWQLETDPTKSSDVEITFTALGPDRTRVVLTHRHLDRHGDGWERMRDAVGSGWSLQHFAEVAAGPAGETVLGRALPRVPDEQMHERLAQVRQYTLALWRVTPADDCPDVKTIVWEHGRRNMALVDAGILAVVLPGADDSDLAGIGVFTVGVDETRTVLESDPAIAAGIMTYELHPVRGFPGSTLPA
jgi:uncharacterized protein YndB with AHSA1/START domain